MTTPKRACFVVMGFGKRVDFETGRTLNLDATYNNLIKPAVEEAGLECTRADEIAHSGVIDVPMYQQILLADVVVADVSTANCNAFYELGVRHALRPYTTIVISEDQFKFPFDINRNKILKYKHLGEDIGVSEAKRFTAALRQAITDILEKEPPDDDSPVYTFIHGLRRLKLPDDLNVGGVPSAAVVAMAVGAAPPPDQTHSALMQQVAEAKKRNDFVTAKALLSTIRAMMKEENPDKPDDPFIIQQLSRATYKSKLPTPQQALEEARDLLATLKPETSNDTETLGIWGTVHRRLYDLTGNRGHLDEAVRANQRGFYLRNDYYNGINLAYVLDLRAAMPGLFDSVQGRAEAIAVFVQAARIRREVVSICDSLLAKDATAEEDEKLSDDKKYWVLAALAEACAGLGDEMAAQQNLDKAFAVAPEEWMKDSTYEQLVSLRKHLRISPLDYIKAVGE